MDLQGRQGLPGLAYPEPYLKRLASDLSLRFAGIFSLETIERYVLESYAALLRTSTVKAHLATRTIHFATDRLTALGQAKGAIERSGTEVVFVCEQNAGRSQMAAAFMRELSGGTVHVRSAGSMPGNEISEPVIAAMAELGIDMSHEFPKPLTDDVVQAADVVVTMGCGDACAVYPGKRYLDWDLEDPAGKNLETVRGVRDEIRSRVERLISELQPER